MKDGAAAGFRPKSARELWKARFTIWIHPSSGFVALKCRCLTRNIWNWWHCHSLRPSWQQQERWSAKMGEFRMPSLGADMGAAILMHWRVKPGDKVKRGDIIANVETDKGLIEIEVFENGVVDQILAEPGKKLPVGTVLAVIRGEGQAAAPAIMPRPAAAPPPKPAPEAKPPVRVAPTPRPRASPLAR